MSDERVKDPVLDALFHEYDQLTSWTSQIWLASLGLQPVFFTLAGAVLVYLRKESIVVIGVPYAVFFFGLWLGFIHAMDSGFGLHLVELEQKINQRLGLTSDDYGLSFASRFLADSALMPGFQSYLSLLSVVAGIMLVLSSVFSVYVIRFAGWSFRVKLTAFVAVILAWPLNLSVFLVTNRAEKNVKRKKNKIIQNYQRLLGARRES
jgi:hypothetical protein